MRHQASYLFPLLFRPVRRAEVRLNLPFHHCRTGQSALIRRKLSVCFHFRYFPGYRSRCCRYSLCCRCSLCCRSHYSRSRYYPYCFHFRFRCFPSSRHPYADCSLTGRPGFRHRHRPWPLPARERRGLLLNGSPPYKCNEALPYRSPSSRFRISGSRRRHTHTASWCFSFRRRVWPG